MHWLNRKLWIGCFVLLVLLAVNAGISIRAMEKMSRQDYWVAHTQQVIGEAEGIGNLVGDAESGERGYLLTGDKSYLEPFERASKDLNGRLDNIVHLTADNSRQQARLSQLRDAVTARLGQLQQGITLRETGNGNAAFPAERVDRELRATIRSLLTDVRAEEERLLRDREAVASRALRDAGFTFVTATIIATILVVVVAAVLDSSIRVRQRTAAEVRQQEQWLRTTLMSIGDAVIATDARGRIRFLNPAAEAATGYSSHEASGKPVDEVFNVFNEITAEAVPNPVARVISSGQIVGLANHTVLRNRSGQLVPIDDSAAPIKDKTGNLLGVVLVFRDISERRQAEIALRTSDRLAVAGRFAATVAHEINNPLEAVTNLLYLANHADSQISVREYLVMAERELSRMAQITRQTLGFYREAAAPQYCRLSSILDEVIELNGTRINERSIRVIKKYESEGELLANYGELRQVFANLVTNAIEASGAGGTLRLQIKTEATDLREGFCVHIEDEGPGIASDVHAKIFQPFYTTKIKGGTGLGLWVSKEIVERHGGEIHLTSSDDPQRHGTCFTVFLPLGKAAAA